MSWPIQEVKLEESIASADSLGKVLSDRENARRANVEKYATFNLYLPLQTELLDSQNILICGCGGGYDIFSGLPLFFMLRKAGYNVKIGNLCFTSPQYISEYPGKCFGDICVEIFASQATQEYSEDAYFPEYWMSKWFYDKMGEEVGVLTFQQSGVKPMLLAYSEVIREYNIDTVILADGGTDSLMFGDEEELGTPIQDMASIATVSLLEGSVKKKILSCLGLGVDVFHGVNHARFFENLSEIARDGGYLGAFSLHRETDESQKYFDCFHSCNPAGSIVNTSISLSLDYRFGNTHHEATRMRTRNSELFINPLMSMYFFVDIDVLASKVMYLSQLYETDTSRDIQIVIWEYRKTVNSIRQHMFMPL